MDAVFPVGGLRVLVVSAQPAVGERWLAALAGLGASGESAGGAIEAVCRLADAEQPRIALVLIDPALGGMGPLALAAAAQGMPVPPRVAAIDAPVGLMPGLALPLQRAALLAFLDLPCEAEAVSVPCRPDGLVVLVVEDNEINRQITERMLDLLGYPHCSVEDGAVAVDRFAEGGLALILMDVQMPVMDGLEATRVIRSREQERGGRVPIIGLSAHALPEDRALALAAGMDDYLVKPVTSEALGACIRRWLHGTDEVVAAPVDQPGQPVLDTATLDQLRQFGPEVFRDLLQHLLDDLPTKRTAITQALTAGDTEAVRRLGHALKGSSGSVGAVQLAEACAQLMEAAVAGQPLSEPMDGLEAAIAATRAAVRRHLD